MTFTDDDIAPWVSRLTILLQGGQFETAKKTIDLARESLESETSIDGSSTCVFAVETVAKYFNQTWDPAVVRLACNTLDRRNVRTLNELRKTIVSGRIHKMGLTTAALLIFTYDILDLFDRYMEEVDVSKSAKVRELLKQFPEKGNKELAEIATEQYGATITDGLVSVVRSQERRKEADAEAAEVRLPCITLLSGGFMEIYKYHQNGGEWVIRRHHANGCEGVGVANGMNEAESLCEGMNAAIKLVLWHENGGDDPEALNEAIGIAKHAVRPLRLPTCHLCGETEVDCDLESCFTCNKWTCPECANEIETDEGDPVGVICGECKELSQAR